MREDASGRRQRAVMATDSGVGTDRPGGCGERHGPVALRDLSRAWTGTHLPPEVLRRAVREMLVLCMLEEKRLRERRRRRATWEDACDAVDEWLDREGMLEGLTDPGAANRWKSVEPAGEDEP